MLSRLACTKTFINPILVKSAIQNAPKGPRQMFRTFANESKQYQTRAERINERMSLKERIMAPAGPNAFAVGKGALAGGSLLGKILNFLLNFYD